GRRARGRRALRRLQPDERRLPSQPAGDGRDAPGRDAPAVRATRPRAGLQLGLANDPPAELPRPVEAPPLVPTPRAADLSGPALEPDPMTWPSGPWRRGDFPAQG